MGLGSSFAIHAAAVECGSIGACEMGCTSVQLTCGSQNGFVEYGTPLDSLKVVITRKDGQQEEHVLKNPPGGIGDYHAEVGQNPWVVGQLRSKNLQYGDTVEVHHSGYGLKSGIPLYRDWSTSKEIGVTGEEVDDPGAQTLCRYIVRPNVIASKTCGTFCMSAILCNVNGVRYTGQAFCKALRNGRACPTATKCAADAVISPTMIFGEGGLPLGEIIMPREADNFTKFGDPVYQNKGASADTSGGSSGGDSTGGGNTSSGNEAGSGGTLQ